MTETIPCRKGRIYLWLSTLCVAASMVGESNAQSEVVFSYETHYGVSQITVDGNPLLTGCGFGFIGSQSGVDDTSNITSCLHNNDGFLRPFDGSQSPFLRHQLFFQQDPVYKNRLQFGGEIGPSTFGFQTVSMPFDGSRNVFKYYRYPGSQTKKFADILPSYTDPYGGTSHIASAGNGQAWGEIISDKYTIRVTLTGTTKAMPLYFVEYPRIGVRNVEFSFGGVSIGNKENVMGYIEVFQTDSAILPVEIFESETSGFHQVGRADQDGWSVNVADDIPKRFMNYGPYTTRIESGSRMARFRLQVDNTSADNNLVVTVDVRNAGTGAILASRNIRRSEFITPLTYQDFAVAFSVADHSMLEFRTYWHGGSYVKQDKVSVK